MVTGGQLAASWAALRVMGREGYVRVAERVMETTQKLIAGINAIPVSTVAWQRRSP